MTPDPFLGLINHWIGGFAAASFYIPYKLIRRWSWETYWLVGGFFAWIVAPVALATLLVPGWWDVLRQAPGQSIILAIVWGMVWGIGGATYGLTIRYLGVALGAAIALGLCTACGTLLPPLVEGQLPQIASEWWGQVTLFGIAVCLSGIAISGLAGISKERELSDAEKKGSVSEFHFWKGLIVAVICGVLSAAFAYGLAAGKPIADLTQEALAKQGGSVLWQNLPVLVVVLIGGFATNFVWCVYLNLKNRTSREYLGFQSRHVAEVASTEAVVPHAAHAGIEDSQSAEHQRLRTQLTGGDPTPRRRVPLFLNYLFAAAGGVIWYLQFFFYSMGEVRMGKDYAFSSWTLHMASIIIFGTLWGIAFREWRGTSARTRILVGVGLVMLIGSTVIVGYGNFLKPDAIPH